MNQKFTFAGIRRDTQFSPNHIGNDGAIFDLTARNLRAAGCAVNEYSERECVGGLRERYVFSMARDPEALRALQRLEDSGTVAINSGYGAANCYRSAMTRLLIDGGIPCPDSIVADTTDPAPDIFDRFGGRHFWMKRGDFHAIHKEDVSYVRNADEGFELLREYARRSIGSVVLCEHIEGDLVKFYGVLGTNFFRWFYPSVSGHSKFGNEAINGNPRNTKFEADILRGVAEDAAGLLKIDVYGGDAVITPEGAAYLIDMNDWPSFAPFREQAAQVIAERILQRARGVC